MQLLKKPLSHLSPEEFSVLYISVVNEKMKHRVFPFPQGSKQHTTISRDHVVFHRAHCQFARTGSKIPKDFLDGDNVHGPWFFMPTKGCGTALGQMRGYPMIYSPGFASSEEALKAAEDWEVRKRTEVWEGQKRVISGLRPALRVAAPTKPTALPAHQIGSIRR